MKKILMVSAALAVGCYGLMVGSAEAGSRWSAESCRNLQEMKADTYAGGPDGLDWKLIPILRFQRDKCGVNVDAEFQRAMAKAAAPRARRSAPTAEPRRPVHCDTTPKAYGGSYTDCF